MGTDRDGPAKEDEEPPRFASPACAAAEMSDAYAGFMTRDEVVAFLMRLLEWERAVAASMRPLGPRFGAMLARHIEQLGGRPRPAVGTLPGEAAALDPPYGPSDCDRERIVEVLRRALPKIRDDALHADLREMLEACQADLAPPAAASRGGAPK